MSAPKVWGAGFAMVPGWLVKKQPSANAVLVYIHLAMHGSFNPGSATYDECRPSKRTLASGDPKRGYPGTGMSESTVARALKELIEFGAIKGDAKFDPKLGQLPTVYRLVFGSVEEEQAAQTPVSPVTPPPRVTSDTPPRVTSDTPPRVTSDTPPVSLVTRNQEPLTKNPKTKNKRPSALEGQDQNPPLPPTAAEPQTTQVAEAVPGGRKFDPTLKAAAIESEAIRGTAPAWSARKSYDIAELAVENGASVDLVVATLIEMAHDKRTTSSPGRLPHVLAEKTRAAAARTVSGSGSIPPHRERCRRHPTELLDACGPCTGELLAAEAGVTPAPRPEEAQGHSGVALAKVIADKARHAAKIARGTPTPDLPAGRFARSRT